MNLLEAIKSGKPFRRKPIHSRAWFIGVWDERVDIISQEDGPVAGMWVEMPCLKHMEEGRDSWPLTVGDILAEDYEVKG